jgi:hypothetical protein
VPHLGGPWAQGGGAPGWPCIIMGAGPCPGGLIIGPGPMGRDPDGPDPGGPDPGGPRGREPMGRDPGGPMGGGAPCAQGGGAP